MTSLFLPPSNSAPATALVPGAPSLPAREQTETPATKLWKSEDGFGFRDLIDVINPLQHLPVVGTIYRAVTGETIGAAPRLIGGTLFGGPVGFVTSLFNTLVESDTGKDVGAHVVALLDDSKDKSALAIKPAASIPAPSIAHRDEQLAPRPAELPKAATAARAESAQRTAPAFPTLSHRDEQHIAAPAWLPPQTQSPAPAIVAEQAAPASSPVARNLAGFPLTMAQGKINPSPQGPPAGFPPGLPPGLPPAAMAAALARNPALGQPNAGAPSAPVSRGSAANFSAGVPGAGMKGIAQPLPQHPLPQPALQSPAIQSQQLPVAAAPDQVPGAMQQALDKYEHMIKARKAQGQQVSVLN